jgi:hypothetical protein
MPCGVESRLVNTVNPTVLPHLTEAALRQHSPSARSQAPEIFAALSPLKKKLRAWVVQPVNRHSLHSGRSEANIPWVGLGPKSVTL